jgi:hypothetical protein
MPDGRRVVSAEVLGAGAGLTAAMLLALGYAVTFTTAADLSATDGRYVQALLDERAKWELVTLVRLTGGTLMLWFMAAVSGRLRVAEREPGSLAAAVFGLGVVWAGVWLLSAFFNSGAILLASTYRDPSGARLAGILARETPYVLSGCVMCGLLLATSLVVVRSGGFPTPYGYTTAALAAALAVLILIDWYGTGNLGPVIVAGTLGWTVLTSIVLVGGRASRQRRAP